MENNIRQQRICGLLGGLTYVSTVDYYNHINRMVNEALPGHSSSIHIVSVDFFHYVKLLEQSEWSKAIDYLVEGVRQLVNSGIDFLELSSNIFTEESKQIYLKVIQRLRDEHNVEGIVLGCTEIPLLVKQSDIPHVLLFDSTQLHAQLAVDYQLGRQNIEAFLP
ncbi:unnamed protein product [Rotaria sordida]|uniref:Aspartate racemase n=1 Tax=Rotaria sordida TaxID=392033 RepID=A0A815II56_9BILA|nr:unnamed protein product [Rotaria sordida]CAF1365750.1 unnamed protein product [Rotaria sordida]